MQSFIVMSDISRGGSSAKTYNSNSINHLKRDHPVDFKNYKEKKKVQELKEKEAAEKWGVGPKQMGMN